MSKLSTKPNLSEYGKSNWEELYFLAKHWKSDLEFYKDDLRFLHNLIEKYLIWITKKENLVRVADIRKKEHELTLSCDELHQKVSSHVGMASTIIGGENDSVKNNFFTTHAQLENEIAEFVKAFRESRKEVFKVTEYVLDSEELRNILDS